MNKRLQGSNIEKMTVGVNELKDMLSVGRGTAAKIGAAAGASIKVGSRTLYRVDRIEAYLDSLSEVTA